MPKTKDTYMVWKEQKILSNKSVIIEDLVSQNTSQRIIASKLGISEKTLIKLKKEHTDLLEAFIAGSEKLKTTLINALYKKAVGMTVEDEVTTYEVVDGRKKQRIVKTKKTYPPDTEAIKYLLAVKFGREYSPKKYELELMEKRIEGEKWIEPTFVDKEDK